MVISETPVTVYQEWRGAPKKRMPYMCRIQTPAPADLHQEWRLPDGGIWGYVFNYATREVCFYQLEREETYGPLTVKAIFTSTDWSMLTLLGVSNLRLTQKKEEEGESVEEREKKRIVASVMWETKASGSGRWYYKASHQTTGESEDKFILEYFSRECGAFQTALSLPFSVWLKSMEENAEKIDTLFVNCQTSRDVLMVKKTLQF